MTEFGSQVTIFDLFSVLSLKNVESDEVHRLESGTREKNTDGKGGLHSKLLKIKGFEFNSDALSLVYNFQGC